MTIYAKWVEADIRFAFSPDDNGGSAIEPSRHIELLDALAVGKRLTPDADGRPVIGEPGPYIPTDADLFRFVASRRYEAETSGTTVDGIPVNTERDSQALLTGAALQAMLDPNYTVRWKTAGGFVELDAQQIIGLASAVRAHVQACFDREAELIEASGAGTYSAEMLSAGWPNQ